MRKLFTTVALVLFYAQAYATAPPAYVISAVFSITSSAATATPNLRVQPMGPKVLGKDDNGQVVQAFRRQAGTTQNLYLTGSGTGGSHAQTVDLSSALCLYVEVDQATKMYLNSETAYILLPSGAREVQCFK